MTRVEQLRKRADAERSRLSSGKVHYSTSDLKEDIINFHYQSGMSITALSRNLKVNSNSLNAWKKLYGTDATGYRWGKTVRYDVRTKCLAIADEIDNGLSTIAIANKYNITRQQYSSWKHKYKDEYRQHIESLLD